MSTHKHFDLICVAVLVCTILLTVLFINGSRLGIETVVDGDSENSSDSVFFTLNDRDGDWDSSGATRITLQGDRASVSGSGAYAYDGDVVIAQSGRYVLSGTLADGSVIVSADSYSKVWLLLDGAEINCSDDACLRVDQADKVFLTLAAGSENSMTSGAEYAEEAVADKRGGVIFSHDDLTVNGSGSLRVTAAYRHGIDVNDELVITGGVISIDAPLDAIHANDGLRVEEAALTLKAGDEGMTLQGGDTLLVISSGSLDIESGGAGIKAENDLLIEGGALTIRSEGDALHCAGTAVVTDGALNIDAGDDGIHADKTVSVSGGSILMSRCYEGIEAKTIDVSGGELELYPSDDGLNANGGSGGFPGMPGQQSAADSGEETWIHVSGGSITVVNTTARDADGLDSNGDILISGGVIRVSLSADGSNSAIDYGSESGGVCEISGGEVVACGSSTMAEGFSESSTQCAVLYNISTAAPAGTTVSLLDADGNALLSYTPEASFTSVALSSPAMKLGETYTVLIGGLEDEISLEEVSAAYGDAKSGGFFGSMNWGGLRERGQGGGGRPGGLGPRPERNGDSDRPAPPNMGGDQSFGAPPDMDGEMPDFSDRPAPPNMGGNQSFGAPPDMDGEMPDFSDRPAPPDMGGGQPFGEAPDMGGTEQSAEEAPLAEAQTLSPAAWALVCFSFLSLAAGILFALKYKV